MGNRLRLQAGKKRAAKIVEPIREKGSGGQDAGRVIGNAEFPKEDFTFKGVGEGTGLREGGGGVG